MRFIPVLILVVACILFPSTDTFAKKRSDLAPDRLPFSSRGDLQFHLDVCGFRGDDALSEEEIYVSITNDQLEFSETAGAFSGQLRFNLEIVDAQGKKVVERTEVLEPTVSDPLSVNDRLSSQSIRSNIALPPGDYMLWAQLTDLKSQKPGIWDQIRKNKRKGEVTGSIRVDEVPKNQLGVSGVVFAQLVASAPDEVSADRNGLVIDANPSRQFGMVLPRLSYYTEVYSGSQFAPGDSVFVRASIRDASGGVHETNLRVASPSFANFAVHDELELRSLARGGTYTLEVLAENRRTGETARIEQPFEVLWAIESWSRDEDEMLQEMKLILRHSEYEELERLSPGAREVFLAEFWRDMDPNPETPKNEAIEEFRRRVAYADREFDSTLGRGLVTDQGRVYVRYGPPDDIAYQYSSSAFGDDQNVERVSDPAERVGLSNRPGASFLSPDEFREGDVSDLETQRGGTNIKSKQLEIWSYDSPGMPLVGRTSSDQTSRNLEFIFADEMGNGEYELIGSKGTTDF